MEVYLNLRLDEFTIFRLRCGNVGGTFYFLTVRYSDYYIR